MSNPVTVWRLIAHHEKPLEAAQWTHSHSRIALGWGQVGDLMNLSSERDVAVAVAKHYPDYPAPNKAARNLWDFSRRIAIGDHIIVSAMGTRIAVYEVTGAYVFTPTANPDFMEEYPHQRKVIARVDLNVDTSWQQAGGQPSATYNRFFALHPLPVAVAK